MSGFQSSESIKPESSHPSISEGIKAVPTYDERKGVFTGARSVLRLRLETQYQDQIGFFDVACKVGGCASRSFFGSLSFLVKKRTGVYVLLDKMTKEGQQIYVNVNSAANRLGLLKQDIIAKSNEGCLFEYMEARAKEKAEELNSLIPLALPMTESMSKVASYALKLDLKRTSEKDQVIQVSENRLLVMHKLECIDLGRVLGSGAFGKVQEVSYLGSKRIGALKRSHGRTSLDEYNTIQSVIRLAKAQSSWPAGVLEFYEPIREVIDLRTGKTSFAAYILSEKCESDGATMLERRRAALVGLKGKTLHDKKKEIMSVNIRNLATIFSGYEWLSRHGIILIDVKPENVLFKEDGSPVVSDLDVLAANQKTCLLMDKLLVNQLKPEDDRQPMLRKIQVFGMGVLAYQMLRDTSSNPDVWVDDPGLEIERGLHYQLSKDIKEGYADHSELADFIIRMLNPDHTLRPTAEESLDFFKGMSI